MTDQDNRDNSDTTEEDGVNINVIDEGMEMPEELTETILEKYATSDHDWSETPIEDLTPGPQAHRAFRSLQRCAFSKDCPGFGPDHMEHANVKARFDEAVEKVQEMNKGGDPIPFEEAVQTVRNLPEHVVDHLAQKAGTPEQQVADINAALPDGVELEVATPPAGATEDDMAMFNDFISNFSTPKAQKTITNPAKDRSLSGKKRKKAIREARRLYGKEAL